MPPSDDILDGALVGLRKGLEHMKDFFDLFAHTMQHTKGEERNQAVHDFVQVALVFSEELEKVAEQPISMLADPTHTSRVALRSLEEKWGSV